MSKGGGYVRTSLKRWIEKLWHDATRFCDGNMSSVVPFVGSCASISFITVFVYATRILLVDQWRSISERATTKMKKERGKEREREGETESKIKNSMRLHSVERGVINAATIGSVRRQGWSFGGEISDNGSAWNEKIMRRIVLRKTVSRRVCSKGSHYPVIQFSKWGAREFGEFQFRSSRREEKPNESFRATKFRVISSS